MGYGTGVVGLGAGRGLRGAIGGGAAGTQVKKGSFGAQVAGGNQVIADVGFEAKVLLLWATRQAAPGDAGAFSHFMGFVGKDAGGDITQIARSGHSDDASASSNTVSRVDSTAGVLLFADGNGTIECEGAVTILDEDGFTINWSNAPGSAWLIHYLAIGGAGVEAHAGVLLPTPLGAKAVNGVGFAPDGVMFMSGASLDGIAGPHHAGFGVAAGAGNEASCGIVDRDNQGAANASSRYETTAAVAQGDNGGALHTADLTSFDADGFTLNVTLAQAVPVAFLALRGVDIKVGEQTQPVVAGAQAIAGLGFEPKGVLLASSARNAVGVALGGSWAFGASDGVSEGCISCRVQNGADPMNVNERTSTTKVLGYISDAPVTLAEADLQSLDVDGFTLDWTTADATARKALYVAIG